MIYFDYTATTKPRAEVLEVYNKVNNEYWFNPSSFYKAGVINHNLFNECETNILRYLNLHNKRVIFTSGATEANNLAIYGICNNYLGQNKHIVTTKIEHPSVMSCFNDLENKGFKVTYLNVDEKGIIDLDELKSCLNNDTILVSIMWVNNIVGSIEPIKEVIKILKNYPRIKLHVDAVQGLGKIKPNFDFNEVDMFSFSSHKINGLKSSGALVINDKINLQPVLKGAEQQKGSRPGTIDLSLAVSTTKAIKLIIEELQEHYTYVKELYDYFLEKLKEVNVLINSPINNHSPYILNISIMDSESETFIRYLEKYDIYVAAGSACNSKSKKPEKTVLAMYKDEKRALTSIRISLSYISTKKEIDEFIQYLRKFKEK